MDAFLKAADYRAVQITRKLNNAKIKDKQS